MKTLPESPMKRIETTTDEQLLWALEAAFLLLAGGTCPLHLPAALQRALTLSEGADGSAGQVAASAGTRGSRGPSAETDLDVMLGQWGVRNGRQLHALVVQFGATMATLALAYARQARRSGGGRGGPNPGVAGGVRHRGGVRPLGGPAAYIDPDIVGRERRRQSLKNPAKQWHEWPRNGRI